MAAGSSSAPTATTIAATLTGVSAGNLLVAIVGFGANPATTAALRSASPAAVRLALAAAL